MGVVRCTGAAGIPPTPSSARARIVLLDSEPGARTLE